MAVSLTICGIGITPFLLKKNFTPIIERMRTRLENNRKEQEKELSTRRNQLMTEVAAIHVDDLRRSATEHFNQEMSERKGFGKRFALSPREKAQLTMKSLASDESKSFYEIVRSVAREASPQGADIRITTSTEGIELNVDFDMSSMTSGEYGTRTKHQTIESLRKEVDYVTSRVANDILQFCKALKIEVIHIGCRHYTKASMTYGDSIDQNTLLYKVSIQKNRVKELTSNPYLDFYSTTKYMQVETDNFDNIKIIKSRL